MLDKLNEFQKQKLIDALSKGGNLEYNLEVLDQLMREPSYEGFKQLVEELDHEVASYVVSLSGLSLNERSKLYDYVDAINHKIVK